MDPGTLFFSTYLGKGSTMCMNVTVLVISICIESILYSVGSDIFLRTMVSVLFWIERSPDHPQKSTPS